MSDYSMEDPVWNYILCYKTT